MIKYKYKQLEEIHDYYTLNIYISNIYYMINHKYINLNFYYNKKDSKYLLLQSINLFEFLNDINGNFH